MNPDSLLSLPAVARVQPPPTAEWWRRGWLAGLLAAAALLPAVAASAATTVWNFTSGDRNWSTPGNWSGAGAAPTNDVVFGNTDAQTATAPANVVDVSTTVRSLSYTNSYTNSAAYLSFQNTTVAGGQTLTITNGLNVGVGNSAGYPADPYTYASLSGAGARVAVTGGNVQVGYQSSGSASYYVNALLDLRGLDVFTYSNSAGTFGVAAAAQRRQRGEVYLAGTNSIVAAALTLGSGTPGITSKAGTLHLGATNNVAADSLLVGRVTQASLLDFQTGLDNPVVKVRAKDGTSAVPTWYVGLNHQANNSSTSTTATNDFSAGILDAVVNNLYLGYCTNNTTSSANNYANGYFFLGTNANNSLVVQNLYLGSEFDNVSASGYAATGVLRVNGGTVAAGSVTLARKQGSGNATGSLLLNSGATMTVSGSITNGGGVSSISVANAALTVAGRIGAPTATLGTLTLSNAALGLTLSGSASYADAPISVDNVMVDGAAGSSVITIKNIVPPGQYPLIAYSGLSGEAAFSGLSVQTPAGMTGTLSNNMSAYPFTVDVVLTAARALAFTTPPLTLPAGNTSDPITIQLQTANGTPLTTTSNLTVNLSTTSGSGLFRDVADTTTIATVVIPAGGSSASFRYKDTAAPATPTLTASTAGASPGAQQETITVGAAAQLGFTPQPPDSFVAVLFAPVVVQVQDAYGNPVAQSGTPVSLALNGGSLTSGTLTQYTDWNGQASFSDLLLMVPATGLNFSAAATGFATVTSSNFNVVYRTIVKARNTDSMDLASSWVGGTVPGQYDIGLLTDSSVINSGLYARAELGVSTTWYGLLVNAWSATTGYTISNTLGSTLTLGAGGITGSNVTHSLNLQPNLALSTAQVWNWDGIGGGLNLSGNIDTGGYALALGGSRPISVTGIIAGTGALVKQGTNTLTLSGANTYTGATTVSNGTLLVNGSLVAGGPVTVAGGTLGGSGVIPGAVTVQSGGQLAPGAGGIGALTLSSNLTLNPGSSVLVEVDPVSGASDLVAGLSHVAYAGTLVVSNLSGTLAKGSQFALFAAQNPSGNFSSIAGSPGPGLAWSFEPSSGILSVVDGLAINPTNLTAVVSGSTLTLSWPADHLGWVLQAQTNSLSLGLTATNWVDVPNSSSSTTNVVTVDPLNPAVFFRLRLP